MGKLTTKDLKADNLKGSQWIGIVEDTNDDLFEGRCRIRVFGKMDQREDPEDATDGLAQGKEAVGIRYALCGSSGSSL